MNYASIENVFEFMQKNCKKILKISLPVDDFGNTSFLVTFTINYISGLYIHEKDSAMLASAEKNLSLFIGRPIELRAADGYLKDGDTITIGDIVFTVLETPGHTPGGISLYTDKGSVFSGDTLFYLSVGRTDFPGGSMRQLNESIKTKLFTLPDKTAVYPGHGPATDIGTEKEQNPFIF